jgi:hypothetical protein
LSTMCRRRLGGSWLARVIRSRSREGDSQLIVSGGGVVEYNVQKAVGGQLVGEGDEVPVHWGRRQSADCVRRRGC